MAKIYLSPPYHWWNPCCYKERCNETDHGNDYCDKLEPYLTACGIEFKRGPRRTPLSNEDGTALMKIAVAESNEYAPDLHYITHSNASNGSAKGSRPQVYTGSVKGLEYANKIIEYRKKIYPSDCKIVQTTEWYELYATKAPAVYEELIFHDNMEDANWFHENMRLLAEYSCRAFCDVLGIPFIDPYAGDVNGDGSITASDALLTLQAAVNKTKLTEEQKKKADMDANGQISASDAQIILKKSVGK